MHVRDACEGEENKQNSTMEQFKNTTHNLFCYRDGTRRSSLLTAAAFLFLLYVVACATMVIM
jgi:hypothetical protein